MNRRARQRMYPRGLPLCKSGNSMHSRKARTQGQCRSARLSSMSNYKGLTAGSAWIAGFAGLGWLLSGLLNGWLIARPTFLPVPFVQLLFPETIALATWRTVDIWPVIHSRAFHAHADALHGRRLDVHRPAGCPGSRATAAPVLRDVDVRCHCRPLPRRCFRQRGKSLRAGRRHVWRGFSRAWNRTCCRQDTGESSGGGFRCLLVPSSPRQRQSGIRQRASFSVPRLLVAVPAVLAAGALVVAIPQAQRETKAQAAVATAVSRPARGPGTRSHRFARCFICHAARRKKLVRRQGRHHFPVGTRCGHRPPRHGFHA